MCVLVEITGLEPVASSTPRKRATICAISRNKAGWKLLPASRAQLRSFSMCSYEIVCVMLVRVERLELSASWSQITRSSQTELHPDIKWGSVLDQPKLQGPCSDLNRSLFLLVLQTGIEPVTSRLSVVYSNHLSYWSISRQVIFLILTGVEPVSFSWKENVITNRL